MKTYHSLYLDGRKALLDAGFETAREDARFLLSFASGKSVSSLIASFALYASPEIEELYLQYIGRRLQNEPVAYITGSWEFHGLPLYVNRHVLIPRFDTESLIDAALSALENVPSPRILDLCTGSGCIACALASELPDAEITALDNSHEALAVARKNIRSLSFGSRVTCLYGDVLLSPPHSLGSYDLIISNPPYIESSEVPLLEPSVCNYEPLCALDGGKDGLDFYRSIVNSWSSLLRDGASLIFEVGENQADSVKSLLTENGFTDIRCTKDSFGTDRAVSAINRQLKI